MPEFGLYDKELQLFVQNGKNQIASAITNKGISTGENSNFQTLKDNILKIQDVNSIFVPYTEIWFDGNIKTGTQTTVFTSEDNDGIIKKIFNSGFTAIKLYKRSTWATRDGNNGLLKGAYFPSNLTSVNVGDKTNAETGAGVSGQISITISSISKDTSNGTIKISCRTVNNVTGTYGQYLDFYALFSKP